MYANIIYLRALKIKSLLPWEYCWYIQKNDALLEVVYRYIIENNYHNQTTCHTDMRLTIIRLIYTRPLTLKVLWGIVWGFHFKKSFFWSCHCTEVIFKVNNQQSPLCVIFNLQTVTQAFHNPWFITGLLVCWLSSLLHIETVHDCSFPLDYTQHVEERWYEIIILNNNMTILQTKIGYRLKIHF